MISPLAMRERYGFEAFRYFLLREMSFGLDAELQRRGAGRAHQRRPREQPRQPGVAHAQPDRARFAAARCRRPDEAAIAEPERAAGARRATAKSVDALRAAASSCTARSRRSSELVDAVNRYIDARAPWKAREGSAPRRRRRAPRCTPRCEALRVIALLLAPVPARAAAEILSRLGIAGRARERALPDDALRWGGSPSARDAQGRAALPAHRGARSLMWLDSHAHLTADASSTPTATPCSRARSEAGVEAMHRDRLGLRRRRDERARRRSSRRRTPACSPASASTRTTRQRWTTPGRASARRLARAPRVVAVGECGLDYHYMHSPRDVQRAVFAEQVALARRARSAGLDPRARRRPDAFDELLEIWRAEGRGDARRRAPLLHRHARVRAARARRAASTISFSGHPHLQEAIAACATSPRRCRSSGCWSRPTRRCSRPRAPRPAQRAGLGRARRRDAGARCMGRTPEEVARATTRQRARACSASPSRRRRIAVSETARRPRARERSRARRARSSASATRPRSRSAPRAPRSIS